ncbi:MAG TPA: LysR family transcriptional regulator [Polyangiaceae bacterium]|nr:LysR family transcriptional regulator [Polyangiaceae bacterium]
MDWNDLRYLLAISEKGSLARASEELGVTKATTSRRLAALEEALGVALVERRPEGMILTPAGLEVLRTAKSVDVAVKGLATTLTSQGTDPARGVVRLTAPPWLSDRLITPMLPRLRETHPGLEVQILGTSKLVNLEEGDADIGLRNVRPNKGQLVSRRVGELAGCIYGSELYLNRRGMPNQKEDLMTHDLLAYQGLGGMPGFEWISSEPYSTRIVFRADDPTGLTAAAAAGMGLTAIPCILGETDPQLRRVESLGVGFSPLYVVTTEALRNLERIRVVLRLVEDSVRDNQAILLGRG